MEDGSTIFPIFGGCNLIQLDPLGRLEGLLLTEAAGVVYIGVGNTILQNAPQVNQFINGAIGGAPSVQGTTIGYGGVQGREVIINPLCYRVLFNLSQFVFPMGCVICLEIRFVADDYLFLIFNKDF